jgi:tetratricopeptide (TPR) repeat protein
MLMFKSLIKFVCTLLCLSLFLTVMARASSNPVLESGINAFQQGKFDEAKQIFSKLMADPSWRFAALYNLGNTAVRQRHLGEALGFYTRAMQINPHDKDTQDNFKFVLSNLGARRLTAPPSNFDIFRHQILDRFTFGEGLALTFLASLFFLFGLLHFVKCKKVDEATLPSTGLISSFILLVFLSSLSTCKLVDSYIDRGTVILEHVDLRSGPNETNASMLEIAEGSEMRVHDVDHDWIQVSPDSGGLMGWIPKTSLMITSGGGPF